MNGLAFFAVVAIISMFVAGIGQIFGLWPFGDNVWRMPSSADDLPAHERREYDEYLATRNYNNLGDEHE